MHFIKTNQKMNIIYDHHFFLEDDNMESISAKCIMIWILDGGKKDWMICMKKVSQVQLYVKNTLNLKFKGKI